MTILRSIDKKQYSKYLDKLEKAKYIAKYLHLKTMNLKFQMLYDKHV